MTTKPTADNAGQAAAVYAAECAKLREERDRLRAANARLQAECDRKQEWIDAVMGQPSFTNKYTYIRRPQPLAKE